MKKILVALIFLGVASSANAQDVAAKYDTKLPIEISSDSLEVLQHDNKAIFRGNVIAVQGKIRLKSDVMTVFYKQRNQQPQQPQPKAADNNMGAITRIEVNGNVLFATPEESAKGDKGDYAVDIKTIHLFGDVILTKDKNVLKGSALEYNLATGRSLLTNNGATVGGSGGGRVRGVFVPNQEPVKPAAEKK